MNSGIWTITTKHGHCSRCAQLADEARAIAVVTGSVGGSQQEERDGQAVHSGSAVRGPVLP